MNFARNAVDNVLEKDYNLKISSKIPLSTRLYKKSFNLKEIDEFELLEIRKKAFVYRVEY